MTTCSAFQHHYAVGMRLATLFSSNSGFSADDPLENACTQWAVEEDKLLFELMNRGTSPKDIAASLRRGENGVKARIKHINNPEHRAFKRLFNVVDDTPSFVFRTCGDVIGRLLWDQTFDLSSFSFTFVDG